MLAPREGAETPLSTLGPNRPVTWPSTTVKATPHAPRDHIRAPGPRRVGPSAGAPGGARRIPARGTGNAHRHSPALLGQCRRSGPARPASGRVGRRTGVRPVGAGDRDSRVRLRRRARPVRSLGDRRGTHRRPRPERRTTRRTGHRPDRRHLRPGVRTDRDPVRRQRDHPRRGALGPCCGRRGGAGAAGRDRKRCRMGSVRRRRARNPAPAIGGSAATRGPCAGQRNRGRRPATALEPFRGRRPGDRHHAAIGRGRGHRPLGHRHRIRVRHDPRAVRTADRTIPGDQAQVRRDDRHHRAGDRGRVGRRPRRR